MDMNFAIGLSQGIAWPWPIAVYLFLAGISGGAVAAAVILNLYRKQAHENTPVLKAASVIGAATILLGMVCLVLDLTNPFNFWRILIYYNPTSVMSLGVMALLVYIPTVCILTLVALRGLLPKVGLGFLDGIVGFFDGWRVVLQWIALVFALTICAYTGFLISRRCFPRSLWRRVSPPAWPQRRLSPASPSATGTRAATSTSFTRPNGP